MQKIKQTRHITLNLDTDSTDQKPLTLVYYKSIWEGLNGRVPRGQDIVHLGGNPVNNCIDNLRLTVKKINFVITIENPDKPTGAETYFLVRVAAQKMLSRIMW